jgi:hypothetical protein
MTSGSGTCTVNFNQAGNTNYSAATQVAETVTATAGPAKKLLFTTQPGGGAGGVAWTTQPTVTVEDALGDTVAGSSASITLAIGTNPGGGVLTCTSDPQSAASGVATFSGCNITKLGTGYTLSATSSGLTTATSTAFNITAGTATKLVFTTEPAGGNKKTNNLTTQPVVTVEDAAGNTVTGSSTSIQLSITSGTGTSGATLTCTTNPLNAASGVATFAGCKISTAGSGYTLTATGGGFTVISAPSFSITN